jgi:hypothetical protein
MTYPPLASIPTVSSTTPIDLSTSAAFNSNSWQ